MSVVRRREKSFCAREGTGVRGGEGQQRNHGSEVGRRGMNGPGPPEPRGQGTGLYGAPSVGVRSALRVGSSLRPTLRPPERVNLSRWSLCLPPPPLRPPTSFLYGSRVRPLVPRLPLHRLCPGRPSSSFPSLTQVRRPRDWTPPRQDSRWPCTRTDSRSFSLDTRVGQ